MSCSVATTTSTFSDATMFAEDLIKLLEPGTIVRIHEPLAPKTTLRVGGPADVYVEPVSEHDLAEILRHCSVRQVPFFVLGRGSNLLVRDEGFRGVVISLGHATFSRIEVLENRMRSGAGARLKTIANEAKAHSVSGFEFLEGIPGTLGGALRMNAGAMGGATFQVVDSVRLMANDGSVRDCTPSEMGVTYRHCELLKTNIALSAVLRGSGCKREEIESRMKQFSTRRWSSQPAAASAGCMFKNPLTIPAGKLIDELGLKGARCGGAMISLDHGNFLVNEGNATAQDVLDLITLVRERAQAQRGIELETEVQIIGEG